MQDEPEQAAHLWSFASRAMIESGWHHISVATVDKLLAAACLLRHPVASSAAIQLLSSQQEHIRAAFPTLLDAPASLQACAWHALLHFCPQADLDMDKLLFLDVKKSQASLFFGEVVLGEPVLRPAAVRGLEHSKGGAKGQLVGLAQHCDVRVCITSRLPVAFRLRSCLLNLQHVVYKAPTAAPAPPATAAPANVPNLGKPPVDQALNNQMLSTHSLQNKTMSVSKSTVDDTESCLSGQLHCGHRRTASSWRSPSRFAQGEGHQRPTVSGTSLDCMLDDAPPHDASTAILRDWSDSYVLDCPEKDGAEYVSILPGDTYVTFSACPVQEGVHLLDCVQAALDCPSGHSLFIGARSHSDMEADMDEAAVLHPFGAAVVATASEENIAIVPVLPGGALFESCCQWVGLQVTRTRGEVRDLSIRTMLRPAESGALLEFAQVVAGEDVVNGGPGTALGQPDCAFWEASSTCAQVKVGSGGTVPIPGRLEGDGTLWLPVCCWQQPRLLELVDIGGHGMASESGSARQEAVADGYIEVTVNYWSGCCRSKHVRLRMPVQVHSPLCVCLHASNCAEVVQLAPSEVKVVCWPVHAYNDHAVAVQQALLSTVTARPMGVNALALQVTQTLCTPFPVLVTQQELDLQAGLKREPCPFSGPSTPFTIEAKSTHLATFVVSRDSSQTASNMAQLVCRLHTVYSLAVPSVASLPLILPPASISGASAGLPPRGRRSSLLPAVNAQSMRRLPAAAAVLLLRGRETILSGDGSMMGTQAAIVTGSAATRGSAFKPSAAMMRRIIPGEHAALCMHLHPFSLELSSFSALTLLQRGTSPRGPDSDGEVSVSPVISFMGPRSVLIGCDSALMWRIRWPSDVSFEYMLGTRPCLTQCAYRFACSASALPLLCIAIACTVAEADWIGGRLGLHTRTT
jgi:hypothetical protein